MKLLSLENPFGAPVYHEETVSSTFDAARLLANENKAHGTVICADYQEAGRGRLNRSWINERGKNLLFTILLRYGDFSLIPGLLTLKTGLAVSLAVEDCMPVLDGKLQVKWPNDVMLNLREAQSAFKGGEAACKKMEAIFKKIAGILIETDGNNVYIGVGVNVAQTEFPQEYSYKAGSIIQALPSLPLDVGFILLEKILFRLYEEIESPKVNEQDESWRERLLGRLYKKGEIVRFAEGAADCGSVVEGTLSGLGPEGELLIVPKGEKKERSFVTGELLVY